MTNKTMPALANVQTMTSREIAELTGKRHDNVLRDIAALSSNMRSPSKSTTYLDSNKIKRPQWELSKRDTLLLISGYSVELRAKIIDRWQELESQQAAAPAFQLPQTFSEALQLAAEQARQLELAAPKVETFDRIVERGVLMTATQVGQKLGMSAIVLNRHLSELGVYNGTVKRSKAFKQWFIDKGYGEMKQTDLGHSQALFTNAGEMWINQQFAELGIIE